MCSPLGSWSPMCSTRVATRRDAASRESAAAGGAAVGRIVPSTRTSPGARSPNSPPVTSATPGSSWPHSSRSPPTSPPSLLRSRRRRCQEADRASCRCHRGHRPTTSSTLSDLADLVRRGGAAAQFYTSGVHVTGYDAGVGELLDWFSSKSTTIDTEPAHGDGGRSPATRSLGIWASGRCLVDHHPTTPCTEYARKSFHTRNDDPCGLCTHTYGCEPTGLRPNRATTPAGQRKMWARKPAARA